MGFVLLAGGLLFLTVHLGESARKAAEKRLPTSALPVASDKN